MKKKMSLRELMGREAQRANMTPEQEFAPLYKYIKENYLDIHPKDYTLERLEQLKGNIETWGYKISDSKNDKKAKKYFKGIVKTLNSKIKRLKSQTDKQNKKPNTQKGFNSSLTDIQIEKLAEIINEHKIFSESTNAEQVKDIFNLSLKEPINVEHIPKLAWLFNSLKIKSLITQTWQSVSGKNKIFKGSQGHFITANSLSKSLTGVNQADEILRQISKSIDLL